MKLFLLLIIICYAIHYALAHECNETTTTTTTVSNTSSEIAIYLTTIVSIIDTLVNIKTYHSTVGFQSKCSDCCELELTREVGDSEETPL